MGVMQNLQDQIVRAVNAQSLDVSTWSQSANNVVLLLNAPNGRSFFAKIFALEQDGGLPAQLRYRRERDILRALNGDGAPRLLWHADQERVLVTAAIEGFGVKYFLDKGRAATAVEHMARWVARFHQQFETTPVEDQTLWTHVSQYPRYAMADGFDHLEPLLSSMRLRERVMSRGDCSATNFKFNRNGTFGLDFEGAALRAKEIDLLEIVSSIAELTGESVEALSEVAVQHYALVRPIDDKTKTVDVISRLSECLQTAK
jgi:hypothetical protein